MEREESVMRAVAWSPIMVDEALAGGEKAEGGDALSGDAGGRGSCRRNGMSVSCALDSLA